MVYIIYNIWYINYLGNSKYFTLTNKTVSLIVSLRLNFMLLLLKVSLLLNDVFDAAYQARKVEK